jgi:predicted NBD/HSP70 family sugar kinase
VLIGLELDDARVVAVAVSDAGAVQKRAQIAVAGTIDAAARAALAQVDGSDRDAALGVAASAPDAPDVAAAMAAFAARASGQTMALASGTAAAFGESWIGAAKGVGHVVYFGVGDRTSGGVVRAGAPVLGARGRAGSVAWMSLNPVEREDYRKIGCLEAEVAALGIVRRLIWRIKAGDRSRVQDAVGGDLSTITVQHVLEAARGGDGVSISVMRDTAKYLGMAAANMAALADPETLVLGGLMASAADLLLEPVRVEIARRMPRPMLDGLTIVPAALGDDAAAIGAARFGASAGART